MGCMLCLFCFGSTIIQLIDTTLIIMRSELMEANFCLVNFLFQAMLDWQPSLIVEKGRLFIVNWMALCLKYVKSSTLDLIVTSQISIECKCCLQHLISLASRFTLYERHFLLLVHVKLSSTYVHRLSTPVCNHLKTQVVH